MVASWLSNTHEPVAATIPHSRGHGCYNGPWHTLFARGVFLFRQSVVSNNVSMLVVFVVGLRIGSRAGGSRGGEGGRGAYCWCGDEAVQLRGTEKNGAGEPGKLVSFCFFSPKTDASEYFYKYNSSLSMERIVRDELAVDSYRCTPLPAVFEPGSVHAGTLW